MMMSDLIDGDGDFRAEPEPDAHGQAALLLAESILHGLVEAEALSRAAALSVIATACEVKFQVAQQAGESNRRMTESLELLHLISKSFDAYPEQ
jgi:hypothetical protein